MPKNVFFQMQKDLATAHVAAAGKQAQALPQVVLRQQQPALDPLTDLKTMAALLLDAAD